MDDTLADIRAFLTKHPPFDSLPTDAREALLPRIERREFTAEKRILKLRQHVRHLYIVRSGRVELRGADGEVWAMRTAGDTFGVRALLGDGRAAFQAMTLEPSTLLLLPDHEFSRLRLEHSEFERFFTPLGGTSARLAAVEDRLSAESQPNLIALRVRDLMTPTPLTVDADCSIQEAAKLMRDHRISCLPITSGGALTGIVTNVDLRDRIVAEGVPAHTPIGTVMTREPFTLQAESLACDALLTMRERTVRHLPVVDGEGW
jgi:CBS domain-containing protein